MNRESISINNDDAQCEAFKVHQDKYVKDNDMKNYFLFP